MLGVLLEVGKEDKIPKDLSSVSTWLMILSCPKKETETES